MASETDQDSGKRENNAEKHMHTVAFCPELRTLRFFAFDNGVFLEIPQL